MNLLVTESVIYRKQFVLEVPRLLRTLEREADRFTGEEFRNAMFSLKTMRHLHHAAQQAMHFIVAPHFMDLVVHASNSIPDNAVFDETVLLSPHGWAEITANFSYTDDGGMTLDSSGALQSMILVWSRYDASQRYFTVNDGEQYMFTLIRKVKIWQGEALMHDTVSLTPGMLLRDPNYPDRPLGPWNTLLYSLLHLMAQKLAVTSIQRPQGYIGHAVKKLKMNAEEVRVVTLRRYYEEERESRDSGREYHCRWTVRGHWRQQYYPSLGVTRPLFIEAYIKGPENMPFKDSAESIFQARR